jgi:hypothetical protein
VLRGLFFVWGPGDEGCERLLAFTDGCQRQAQDVPLSAALATVAVNDGLELALELLGHGVVESNIGAPGGDQGRITGPTE